MAFATTIDFEVRHGPLTGDEEGRVEALLEDAEGLIHVELSGSGAKWLEEGSEEGVPAAVKAVCLQVAYRAWSNSDGVAREELGAAARTYRGTDQADVLWLTKAEARMLRKAASVSAVTSIQVETSYSGDPEERSPLDFWPLSEGS
jgi:hypothetical protein